MDNVEKKVAENFAKWREENNKKDNNEEAIEKDIKEYMHAAFQIKRGAIKSESVNILDILDTMIAPNVESAVAVNSVRENIFACKESSEQTNDAAGRRKRQDACTCLCSNADFRLSGSNCYKISLVEEDYTGVNAICIASGAKLATITNSEDEKILIELMPSKTENGNQGYWIGLNDQGGEGRFVWQDGSIPNYMNWGSGQPDNGTGKNCVVIRKSGKWHDDKCENARRSVCSMPAEDSCTGASCALTGSSTSTSTTTINHADSNLLINNAVRNTINEQSCMKSMNTAKDIHDGPTNSKLPDIDIFLNPTKKKFVEEIIKEKRRNAKSYFRSVDWKSLYPELFKILWESTLPCYKIYSDVEPLLLSCHFAGSEVDCSELFTKVPTDSGMCCALNNIDALRNSSYKELVTKMQNETLSKKIVTSQVGEENGLRLTLDLHSNTVSFGTLNQEYQAFKVFVGDPAEFPMMRENSLKVEPGREHFVHLSATVVNTSDIKDIDPDARDCFFPDEGDLDFYERYTFSNCRLECAIKKTEKMFKCVPWHLPRVKVFRGCS